MNVTHVFASALLGAALFASGCGGEAAAGPDTPESHETRGGKVPMNANGWYAIRASNGRWVSANYGGYVVADRTVIGPWEKFYLVDLGNTDSEYHWALVASNNQIVSADLTKGARLVANRNGVGPWEEFQIFGTTGCGGDCDDVMKARSTGKYVSADLTLGGVLIANRDRSLEWETFSMWPVSPP
jgi:hypothetical protein